MLWPADVHSCGTASHVQPSSPHLTLVLCLPCCPLLRRTGWHPRHASFISVDGISLPKDGASGKHGHHSHLHRLSVASRLGSQAMFHLDTGEACTRTALLDVACTVCLPCRRHSGCAAKLAMNCLPPSRCRRCCQRARADERPGLPAALLAAPAAAIHLRAALHSRRVHHCEQGRSWSGGGRAGAANSSSRLCVSRLAASTDAGASPACLNKCALPTPAAMTAALLQRGGWTCGGGHLLAPGHWIPVHHVHQGGPGPGGVVVVVVGGVGAGHWVPASPVCSTGRPQPLASCLQHVFLDSKAHSRSAYAHLHACPQVFKPRGAILWLMYTVAVVMLLVCIAGKPGQECAQAGGAVHGSPWCSLRP